MDTKKARQELVDTVDQLANDSKVVDYLSLKKERGQNRWERDDVIWFELVLSLSTWRGSRGARLLLDSQDNVDEEKFARISFNKLASVAPENRASYLEDLLREHNVNMHVKKADYLTWNFNHIHDEWETPLATKEAFNATEGPKAKIKFLKQFKGIGNKYARNIGMDLYHPDFRDFIAIDARITSISEELGLPTDSWSYDEHEAFYHGVVAESTVENAWELDRILYQSTDQVLEGIRQS